MNDLTIEQRFERLEKAALELVKALTPIYEFPGYSPTVRMDWRARDHVLDALGIDRQAFQEEMGEAWR